MPEVAFCLAATSGRHTGTDWSRSYVSYYDEVRRLTPTECERLQGFPEGWTLPGEDFHLSDEDIDSLRYHAIGNAVSVPVVEWIAQRIRVELSSTTKKNKAIESHLEVFQHAIDRVPDFALKNATYVPIASFTSRDDAPKVKWGSGGVMAGGQCLMTSVSFAPNKPVESRFVNILDKVIPPERYFLSSNAAKGILRRVASQDRELFGALNSALRHLASKDVNQNIVQLMTSKNGARRVA